MRFRAGKGKAGEKGKVGAENWTPGLLEITLRSSVWREIIANKVGNSNLG